MEEAFQANVDTPVEDSMIFRLDSQNTQEESFRVVSDTLPAIPEDAKMVAVTINDGTALGTIAAVEAAGRAENLMVVGQNADPSGQEEMIKDNSRYLGATAYFPENYGAQLLPEVIKVLECEQVPPSIFIEHVFVSAENVCEFYPESWPEFCEVED
jgi:ABC-type sugar transport system substrate-binding protein